MAGRNYNPPPSRPPDYCPDEMGLVAPLINGCATVAHVGNLEGADLSPGDFVYNTDGLGMVEVWDGKCPQPYLDGFVGMMLTLPDGSMIKAVARDDATGKVDWEPVPPTAQIDCDAVVACILNAAPEQLEAICAALPIPSPRAAETTRAAKAKG